LREPAGRINSERRLPAQTRFYTEILYGDTG
jgi:hypothetical protein